MTQCIEALAETAPEQRSPYNSGELMEAITAEYNLGFESGLAEMIRFYSFIHPQERRVIFQLAEIAGQIQHSAEMEIFKQKQSQNQ